MSSKLSGAVQLKKLFRKLPDEVTKGVRVAMEDTLQAIKVDAQALAPTDEGDLIRSIEYKIAAHSLSGVVGPGASGVEIVRRKRGSVFATRNASSANFSAQTKHDRFQFFKGYWIEFGTKGSPEKSIPPQPARPFMNPAFDLNVEWGKRRVCEELRDALRRVATG